MTDHHNDHDGNDEENHDDCQDCKRQRAQNDRLIEIYEKLQQVDQRTNNMKSSVVNHKDKVQKSFETMKKIDQKVDKIKNNKQEQNKSQFQQLGFTLFADLIEKQKKSQVQKENLRLKQILKNIYEQRSKNTQQISVSSIQKKSTFTQTQTSNLFPYTTRAGQQTAAQWFQKAPVTSRSGSRKSSSFRDTQMGKSFEIFSTKSSFNMTKRKTFEKKDFGGLNLWLFEQRNEILQKELYDKSVDQKNQDQIQNRSPLMKLNESGRYTQNAKNTSRLNESMILRSTHLRRPNSLIKRQIKDSYLIENKKSKFPQKQQSPNRFLSKRAKINTIFPVISNK